MNTAKAHKPHDHLHCVSEALDRAHELCRQRNVRMTDIRHHVLELVWGSHAPIGAYAILDQIRVRATKPVAPPTIYRALDFLMEQGLIHRIESLNAYVGCDYPEEQHITQFLICTLCGGAMELSDPTLLTQVKNSAKASGFSVSRLNIEALGLCPTCSEKNKSATF